MCISFIISAAISGCALGLMLNKEIKNSKNLQFNLLICFEGENFSGAKTFNFLKGSIFILENKNGMRNIIYLPAEVSRDAVQNNLNNEFVGGQCWTS